MQLPLTADWLVPLGAGVVILAALAFLWFALRRDRPVPRGAKADSPPPPTAGSTAQPAAPERPDVAVPPRTTSFAAVPAHWSGGSRPAGPPDRQAGALEPAVLPRMAPAPEGPPSGPVPVAPWARAADVEAAAPEANGARAPFSRSGASRSVAAAVAQAFAARVAAGQPADSPQQQQPQQQAPPPATPRDDARDRLLAVLLHDPELAVDATIQLDACRAQLDRLSDAMRHERAALRHVLHRLGGAGLRTDQLARLAGMPVGELQALLAPASSR